MLVIAHVTEHAMKTFEKILFKAFYHCTSPWCPGCPPSECQCRGVMGTFPGVRTVVASDKTRAASLQQYQRSSTEAPTRHPRHNRFAGLGCAHKRSRSPTHTFSKLSRKDASPQATQSCTGLDLFLRKPISIAPQRRHPLCSNFRSLYVIRHALIINC